MEMPPEEYEHYRSVLVSFEEYMAYMFREIGGRKKRKDMLKPEHAALLKDVKPLCDIRDLLGCVQTNQMFLSAICAETARNGPPVQLPSANVKAPLTSPMRHFSKLQSTLHQCVRDWSSEGQAERDMCYGPIIQEILERVPVHLSDGTTKSKVLVPGCGLGRLPLEIAAKGYACQGNEFSYQMLFASDYILNRIEQVEEISINPWIHNQSNTIESKDHTRTIRIPDVCAADLIGNVANPEFSMTAGEFLDVYKNQKESWDCIVTCFFIDAAPNVIEYIEAIYQILKPGGVWINFGPLTYHWQSSVGNDDERYNRSVEFSLEEVLQVVESIGFTLERSEMRESAYTCNVKSMLKSIYNCSFFTAVKP